MAQTQVMALKFLTAGGGGLTSDAVRCIDYARNNGARIISNSWGGKGPIPKVLEQAIQRAQDAGILFVVAAGNDGKNIDVNKYCTLLPTPKTTMSSPLDPSPFRAGDPDSATSAHKRMST